jgi:hypothetical protein
VELARALLFNNGHKRPRGVRAGVVHVVFDSFGVQRWIFKALGRKKGTRA